MRGMNIGSDFQSPSTNAETQFPVVISNTLQSRACAIQLSVRCSGDFACAWHARNANSQHDSG